MSQPSTILRRLVREMINEEDTGKDDNNRTETLKSAFGGFESVLTTGFESGASSYGEDWGDADPGKMEKLAVENNDSTFENIVRHAYFIYDIEAIVLSIDQQLESIQTVNLEGTGQEALSIDISNAEDSEVEAFLSVVNEITEKIGRIVGYANTVASRGWSGGVQAIQKKISQTLSLGQSSSECLKNISDFLKMVEGLALKSKYSEIIEQNKDWMETKRAEYGADYDIIEQAGRDLIPSLTSTLEEAKVKVQYFYDTCLLIEEMLESIEETSEAQDKVEDLEKKQEEE